MNVTDKHMRQWDKLMSTSSGKLVIGGVVVIAVAFIGLRVLKAITAKKIRPDDPFQLISIYKKVVEGRSGARLVKLEIQKTLRIYGPKYSMVVSHVPNLSRKNQHTIKTKENPFLPPYQEGKLIMDLGHKHRLLYNKFPIFDYHVLVITNEFQPQNSPLDLQIIFQTIQVTKAMSGIYFYNSGKQSGTSQPHKHVQCLHRESKQLPLVQKLTMYARKKVQQKELNQIIRFQPFDFEHGMVVFEPDLPCRELADQTFAAYKLLHEEFADTGKQDVYLSYNIIGSQDFILFVPRKAEEAYGAISVNALGFTGSLVFMTQQQFQLASKMTPNAILNQITFSNKEQMDAYKARVIA